MAFATDRLSDARQSAADWWADREPAARRWIVAGAAAAAVALVGVVIWASRPSAEPVRGDDPLALANYVRTHEFERLPADQKRPYMQSVRKHMADVEAARRDGRIDSKAYRAAYLCAWMERRLDDMHDYYKLPAAQRQAWLDKQLADKVGGPGQPKPAAAPAAAKVASSDGGLLYDDEAGKAKFEEEQDDFEDDFLDGWTPENKKRWEQYRAAYKQRRAALEAAAAGPAKAK